MINTSDITTLLVVVGVDAVERLCGELRELRNPYVRERIAWVLGQIGDPRAVEPLLRCALDDRDDDVRRAAWEALGKLGYAQAVPLLCRELDEGRPYRRARAAAALGRTRCAAALPALRARLRRVFGETDPGTRRSIADAVAQIEQAVHEATLPIPAVAPSTFDDLPRPGVGPD